MKLELDEDEIALRLFNVSIKSPDHLKQWLAETGRRWLVIDALQLVEALPWPDGLDSLIQIIACYRDHRRTIPSGRTEVQTDPTLGEEVTVPVMCEDTLEVPEMEAVIRFLIHAITEKDPSWTLEKLSQ